MNCLNILASNSKKYKKVTEKSRFFCEFLTSLGGSFNASPFLKSSYIQ